MISQNVNLIGLKCVCIDSTQTSLFRLLHKNCLYNTFQIPRFFLQIPSTSFIGEVILQIQTVFEITIFFSPYPQIFYNTPAVRLPRKKLIHYNSIKKQIFRKQATYFKLSSICCYNLSLQREDPLVANRSNFEKNSLSMRGLLSHRSS